jgi:hypothetical protein
MDEDVDITEPSGPPVMIEVVRRATMPSLSEFERDTQRKSSPPVVARRKELTTYVASAVGVAWFICLFAVGQSALRSMIVSMVHH